MVKKREVEAEEEEAIEPEVREENTEEEEATEVVIEKEVTSEEVEMEEAKEVSEEEEVETEAARSQMKRTRSNNNLNLKSELRTPLPRSEITDLRNFLV